MGELRRHLSYANVMATVAVFVALGGGAWALTRGEVRAKHIADNAVRERHLAPGTTGQVVLASFVDLFVGTGSASYAPVGKSQAAGLNARAAAPSTFIATDLRVMLHSPLDAGSRSFSLLVNGVPRKLECSIAAGESACRSRARVKVRRRQSIAFTASNSGTTDNDDAMVGWRALAP